MSLVDEHKLMPYQKPTHSHTFIVEGQGQFPFDMLRYDSCWPVLESEARTMLDLNKRRITLTHLGERAWEPTEGRWNSYRWRVVPSPEWGDIS